jgi:hypothetical protein
VWYMSSVDFEITVVCPEDRERFVPISCPVCSFLMKNSDDSDSYLDLGCCFDCKMKWAQCRKDDWIKGWRPTKMEINKEIKSRKKIPPAFHL